MKKVSFISVCVEITSFMRAIWNLLIKMIGQDKQSFPDHGVYSF